MEVFIAMLKAKAKTIVLDRATTHYPKSVIAVLGKIIDLTHVEDWQTSQVEKFYSTPKSISKLGLLTNLNRRTAKRGWTLS